MSLYPVYSEDSNQSVHSHSLIRVSVFRLKKHWIIGNPCTERPLKNDQIARAESSTVAHANQWRSKNAEKVTHIKGRLLDQAVVLFNRVPF